MNDLISRQAAIDALYGITAYKNQIPLFSAVFNIEKLPSAQPEPKTGGEIGRSEHDDIVVEGINIYCPNCGYKTTIIGTVNKPQWIPCSERLPSEEKQHYWVCTDTGYQCQCRWTNINHFWIDLTTDWHWHIADVPQYSKVIAWMELPEPYKGVTE